MSDEKDSIYIVKSEDAISLNMKNVFCMQWISVKDRLPENNQQVLTFGSGTPNIHDDGFPIQTAQYWKGEFIPDHFCESSYIENVTHWMPLPPKPEEEK